MTRNSFSSTPNRHFSILSLSFALEMHSKAARKYWVTAVAFLAVIPKFRTYWAHCSVFVPGPTALARNLNIRRTICSDFVQVFRRQLFCRQNWMQSIPPNIVPPSAYSGALGGNLICKWGISLAVVVLSLTKCLLGDYCWCNYPHWDRWFFW